MSKSTGTVKWFDHAKAYGFIVSETGEETFVHYRDIVGTGYKGLTSGQVVEYLAVRSDHGVKAVEVAVVAQDSPAPAWAEISRSIAEARQ